jgi:hypothetical protein
VAVVIGWLAGGESINPGVVISTALMAAGVAMIITRASTSHLSANKALRSRKIFPGFSLNLRKMNKEET